MSKLGKIIVPIILLGVGILLMYLFLGMREEAPRKTPEVKPRIVESTVVQLGPVEAKITAFGTITSAQPVSLISEAKGTVQNGDVPFQPAQSFRKGDLLAKIDDRQIDLDRRSAISDFLAALAVVLPEIKTEFPLLYPKWQGYFESINFDKPLPTIPEADNQKIKLYLSRFNVYKLYFTVKDLEIQQSKYRFVAPFNGSIVSADLRVGSTAREGSLLGSIINLDDLEVELPVPASEIDWLNPDKEFMMYSKEFTGGWQGKIKRVGSRIDERTQSVPIYIALSGQPKGALFDGIFLESELPGRTVEDAIEIPRRAIYDERFVYVINAGKFEYREVDVTREQKFSVIVDGGLQNGDTLVLEPLQGVLPGMPAKPRMVPHGGGGN